MIRHALVLASIVLAPLWMSSTQGSVVVTTSNQDLRTGGLESTIVVDATQGILDPIYLIREQQVLLGSDLAVDGTPSDPMGLGGVIAAGTAVQSWILHFDMMGQEQVNYTATGTYDFGRRILGLLFTEDGLDNTDALLGNAETIYPTGVPYRDSADSQGLLDEWSMPNSTTLDIVALQNQGVGLDQIRVITEVGSPPPPHCPEPGSVAIWTVLCGGLGGAFWWRGRGAK